MLSRFAATSVSEPPPFAAEDEKAGLEEIKRVIVGCRQELQGDSDENSACLSEDTSGKAPVKKAAFKSLPAQRNKLSAAAPRKNLRTPAASSKAVPASVKDLQGQLRSTSEGQTRWPASSPPQTSSLAEVEFRMASEAAMELQSADASGFGAQRAGLATLAMPNTSSYPTLRSAFNRIHSHRQVRKQGSRLLQELGNIFKTLINSNSPGAANTQISTGIHENSYKDVFVCQATPLGLHLSGTVREKIIKGDYVDLLSLLPSAKEFLKSDHKGDTEEEERRRPVARTFTNWLQDFCIYFNILYERFPNLGPGLFKHLYIILEAYRSYGGVAWFLYDDRVRQKMAVHKSMLWGSKDIDLWMGMLAPKPQPLQNQPKNVASRNACWSFNENFCKWQNIAVINMNALFARGHTLPFVAQRDLLKLENSIKENSTKKVITPVILSAMLPYLRVYPNQQKAKILESGFSEGFIIPTDNTKWSPVEVDNLKSDKKYPEIVREKLLKELSYSRIAGPFKDIPLFNMRISPLGVVPKKETGSFRLIHHLSFPNGLSVNDSISPELCSVEYASFDKAVNLLRLCGVGAQLAKSDIQSAIRLLPIHPDCYFLLGFHFDGSYYYDRCLPMGCAISCNYFELFSNFLEWTVKFETGSEFIKQRFNSQKKLLLASVWLIVLITCRKKNLHSAEKPFLGIEIDSVKMEFRLPDAKLQKLRSLLSAALAAKKLTLKHIQSAFKFCDKDNPDRRLIQLTVGMCNPNWHIRIPNKVKEDLIIWQQFLMHFNGRTCWQDNFIENSALHLYSDAAASTGFGVIFKQLWCCEAWPAYWSQI
ncbi:hypothetical protein XELAEV_18012290mg [Xenopus laevis]|uniref:Uncharacterized protein n=1 Tax=Xenopus laevis TaxID=8355 RepID=A0A974HY90_XENLA|nr:hypothetical protein XELAEV_18012290mg [Xenopus laevis]